MSRNDGINTHTHIVRSLCAGSKTSAELQSEGGGKSIGTRIHEINKSYSDIEIVHINGRYQLNFTGKIKIDKRRVYPNQRKAKSFG